jgi:Holliday junction resolvase
MAAHSYNRSAAIGNSVELEVANLCASAGFNVNPIGNIISGAPVSYDSHGQVIAPDLLISKPKVFSHLALEVKSKKPVRGDFWIDEHRVEYAVEWSRRNHMPLLYVIKLPPYQAEDPRAFVCASIDKLYGQHHSGNPDAKDRNGNPCPVLLFDQMLFVPFADFLDHGREVISVEYLLEQNGEELRI